MVRRVTPGHTALRADGICSLGLQYRMIEGVDHESKCPVSGKRKYASESEALATAAHQIANAQAPKELRAYLCSWCDAWHLTKNAGKPGRDRR